MQHYHTLKALKNCVNDRWRELRYWLNCMSTPDQSSPLPTTHAGTTVLSKLRKRRKKKLCVNDMWSEVRYWPLRMSTPGQSWPLPTTHAGSLPACLEHSQCMLAAGSGTAPAQWWLFKMPLPNFHLKNNRRWMLTKDNFAFGLTHFPWLITA